MTNQAIFIAAVVTLVAASTVHPNAQTASAVVAQPIQLAEAQPIQLAQNQVGVISGEDASANASPAAQDLMPGPAAGTAVAGSLSDALRKNDTASLIASALAVAASTTTTTTTTTSTGP